MVPHCATFHQTDAAQHVVNPWCHLMSPCKINHQNDEKWERIEPHTLAQKWYGAALLHYELLV